jgi:curved DNA-binding protein CbpA
MEASDDPYVILGVSQDATAADIKKAYRQLALKHHPDKQRTDEDKEKAHSLFAKISNAYELLSDDEQRQMYDWQQGKGVPQSASRPSTPTRTARTTSSKPTTSNWANTSSHFHDPFSVFEEVFREEFGNDSTARSKSPQKSEDEGPLPPGAVEVSMQTAMKTIKGKSVTVTERVYQLPDGSRTTRVEKNVVGESAPSPKSPKQTKVKSKSPKASPKQEQQKQPKVTTRNVNGMTETTTTFPDGRSETKIEPETTRKKTSPIRNNGGKTSPIRNNGGTRTSTRIVNGTKETTTHFPDGRTETKIEPVGGPGPQQGSRSCSPPTNSRPMAAGVNKPVAKSNNTGATKTQTRIVNGMKETIIERTTTRPDGSTETSFEKKVEAI